jgi:hypothetical protein
VVMYVIYMSVVFSVGTLTTFEYVVSLRIDYGDECDFATDLCMPSIFGKSFSFVRNI